MGKDGLGARLKPIGSQETNPFVKHEHKHFWKPGYEEVFCDCGEVLEPEELARIMNSLPQHPVDDSEYRRPT